MTSYEAPQQREDTISLEEKQWSVSEITAEIKKTLEPSFSHIFVLGELTNIKISPAGHVYFSLKDGSAQLSAAFFGASFKKNSFSCEEGEKVLCHGKISIYAPRGTYQLIVDHIQPVGQGALFYELEKLKKKLEKEGLFALSRKKSLPLFPEKIAIITSPQGAALQDMLIVLKRRAPQIHIRVFPSLVQGEEAPRQLCSALKNALHSGEADIIVFARGGGSAEDLFCFHNEQLARAIAESPIPIISAIGHEIDHSICDAVADVRAPTPSAAAEIISKNWVEVPLLLLDYEAKQKRYLSQLLKDYQMRLTHIQEKLIHPQDRLREQMQKIDEFYSRLESSMKAQLIFFLNQLEKWKAPLLALSPLAVLERGYTFVKKSTAFSHEICKKKNIHPGDHLSIHFYDGTVDVEVL